MNFHEGDAVMHWTYGLGQIVRLEERVLSDTKILYYAVQVRDLTVWVPIDSNLGSRLRSPTPKSGFKQLRAILSSPGNPLPDDRNERRMHLQGLLKDGRAESLCQIIRDLFAYQKTKSLNENDHTILKHAQNTLLEEWGFGLSITYAQAENELQQLLTSVPLEVGV
jgi:RNA polymerase-interacting CarD/CdnL/TRCF family regulator